MNSEVCPCHTPTRKNVTKEANTAQTGSMRRDGNLRIKVRSNGLYTYVLSHTESVMCQRLVQNSMKLSENKGRSKFSGSVTPNKRPTPITISMNPEKLQ